MGHDPNWGSAFQPILDAYDRFGGRYWVFGPTKGPVRWYPGTSASHQEFAGQDIAGFPWTGLGDSALVQNGSSACLVLGPLWSAYKGMGGPAGRLGLPTNDTYEWRQNGLEGYRSDFQDGSLIWTRSTGSVYSTSPEGGWLATFHEGAGFAGAGRSRYDEAINFDWGTQSPGPVSNTGGFSARWARREDGFIAAYSFTVTVQGHLRIKLGSDVVFARDSPDAPWTGKSGALLRFGSQDVAVEYWADAGKAARLQVGLEAGFLIPPAYASESLMGPSPSLHPAPVLTFGSVPPPMYTGEGLEPPAVTSTATVTPTSTPSRGGIVVGGDFEHPDVGSGFATYYADHAFDGWIVESSSIDHIGAYWRAASGRQSVDVTGERPGSIYQDLATVVGQAYRLRFAMAGNPCGPPSTKQIQVFWGSVLVDSPSYDTTGRSVQDMGWTYREYAVVATVPTTRLRFRSLTSGLYGPALDDVSVIPTSAGTPTGTSPPHPSLTPTLQPTSTRTPVNSATSSPTHTPGAGTSPTSTATLTLIPTVTATASSGTSPTPSATLAGGPTSTVGATPTGTPTPVASEQRVHLHAGWNWLSFAVVPVGGEPPAGAPVGAALTSLEGAYDFVLGEAGTYSPSPPYSGANTLLTMEAGKGYLVRMRQPGELVVRGQWLPAGAPLQLATGWRWIGYLPGEARNLPGALVSIEGKYDFLLGEVGTYAPLPALQFLNTLSRLEPGRGYLVRMKESGTLAYDPAGAVSPAAGGQAAPGPARATLAASPVNSPPPAAIATTTPAATPKSSVPP